MGALVSDRGVDTVRWRWRASNDEYREFEHRPEGTIHGARQERYIQTAFGRIGAYPDGMVYLEGRAQTLVAADADDHGLARVADLHSAEQVARQFVKGNGFPIPVDVPAQVGRLDLAAELRFSHGDEGQAFLHALSAVDVPWCKARVDGRKADHIETVSFHGTRGSTIYLRAYDKGIESGTDPAGRRIRVERQRRYRKSREPSVQSVMECNLAREYIGREFSHMVDLPSAVVCDLPEALEVLSERSISWRQAERLAGFLTFGAYVNYPRTQWYDRHAELRGLGIFVDPTQRERLEVPVGRYLQALCSAWAA